MNERHAQRLAEIEAEHDTSKQREAWAGEAI